MISDLGFGIVVVFRGKFGSISAGLHQLSASPVHMKDLLSGQIVGGMKRLIKCCFQGVIPIQPRDPNTMYSHIVVPKSNFMAPGTVSSKRIILNFPPRKCFRK